ncbi:DUF3515 domain-containing protein [Mycolicibacterium diernhoferi]|uniref:DUF3515 domain-containing protein n=1 Tax=Mycolicibacterium diernhoferi TaxID=1801 RepID=A0A1Q4HH01_9MYCO|nr:DUF3515 domain-containing protein [Mycolicibacterium diernhoferi]OJZ66722.1 hypothetical protein BRW64_09595 [Mycolicibacterium diernhoferi]OPE53847.1 hypothetical protein BV510_13430 [Mycolicibacterium diernhoferi]PEG56583.1 DUF3515 domain-containing protein [Mycolicibacterium diernhoferi]
MTQPDEHDGPPRSLIIAAVGVAVAAVIVVLTFAATRQAAPPDRPVAIAAALAPDAESPQCQALMEELPEQLGDYHRAEAVEPVPAGAAAWQADPQADPVILRCGLQRPTDFVVGTPLQVVDTVQWFEARAHGSSTWYAVDRGIYVALTLPTGSGPTPIQLISKALERTMPAQPLDPGPPR